MDSVRLKTLVRLDVTKPSELMITTAYFILASASWIRWRLFKLHEQNLKNWESAERTYWVLRDKQGTGVDYKRANQQES